MPVQADRAQPFCYGPKRHMVSFDVLACNLRARGDALSSSMSLDRYAARELLAFYLEAGVDAVLGETAVDRFAEPADVAPRPAISRPADEAPRADPQAGSRPALDRSRPPAMPAAPI